jgi:hypothetical protein
MKLLAAAVWLACQASLVCATESATYCDLVRSEANVRASLLGSAQAFATLTPGQSTGETAELGVRKSLSGVYRAQLVTELAETECRAFEAEHDIRAMLTYIDGHIERRALEKQLAGLKSALSRAEENLRYEQELLRSHTATWPDVSTALEARDRVRQTLSTTEEEIGRLRVLPELSMRPLPDLLAVAAARRGEAAELHDKLEIAQGWEVSVAAGARRDYGISQSSPFVEVTLSRSLGLSDARAAASRNASLTTRLVQEQQEGLWRLLEQRTAELTSHRSAQQELLRGIRERLTLIETELSQVSGVQTTPALRMARNLAVELLTQRAELSTVEARIAGLDEALGLLLQKER